jgi:hypothetical protein
MQAHVYGDLRIDVAVDDAHGIVRLDWTGRSNHQRPEVILSSLFANVTSQAVVERKAIDMHFERLEFFNSSTITAIIGHIKDLRERRVKLSVTFDPDHRWQRIFFDALRMLDKGDGLFSINPITPSSRR